MAIEIVREVPIRMNADVFYDIFRDRPHHISNMAPGHVQGCALLEGEWGRVGSIFSWNYTHDGRTKVAKKVMEAVDRANKSVTFKVIEGDLMQLYRRFYLKIQVYTRGGIIFVKWTLQYEKLNVRFEDPHSLMDFFISLTQKIEAHHLK